MFPGSASCRRLDAAVRCTSKEPVFRAAIDECAATLKRDLAVDIRDVLYPPADTRRAITEMDALAPAAQPVLFALEYALARLWMHWGVIPTVVVADGARRTGGRGDRGRLLGRLTRSPSWSPVALAAAAAAGKNGTNVNSAEKDALAAVVRRLDRKTPKVAMVAAATGEWLTAEQAVDPEYWAATLLKPSTAADARRLSAPSPLVLLTVAPPETDGPGRPIRGEGAPVITLPTFRDRRTDIESMFDDARSVVAARRDVDWRAVHDQETRVRVPLPTYPFERERYLDRSDCCRKPHASQPDIAPLRGCRRSNVRHSSRAAQR